VPPTTTLRAALSRAAPGTVQRYRAVRDRAKGACDTALGRSVSDRIGLRRRAFERAYRSDVWTADGESRSGDGSTLAATATLRESLPDTLRSLGVRTLLDVPCGDWNWMRHVALPVEHYVGGDLVSSVVRANQARYGDGSHRFRVIDLCTDRLPTADLLLCRDALIHFSNADVWRALGNVAAADIGWFATTTFDTGRNDDIPTGLPWRPLDLRAAPFLLPEPHVAVPDTADGPQKWLAVWSVAELRRHPGRPTDRQAVATISAVQNAQRRAATGMALRHSGHSLVVDSTSGSVLRRAINELTGRTTRKNSTAAMITKLTNESMKAP
jgi:hypothetical protein